MCEESFFLALKAFPADVMRFVARGDERVVVVHFAVAFLAPHRGFV